MLVEHTTTLTNLPSIRERGLLTEYSRQSRKAVWLHPRKMDEWAEKHVRGKHDTWEEDLVHLLIDVPPSWLLKHSAKCYYCFRDIPPSRIRAIRVVRRVVELIPV